MTGWQGDRRGFCLSPCHPVTLSPTGRDMTLSIKCACGVPLEFDDSFAGKQINCPDCQRPLTIPQANQATARTCGFALASLLLALVGAFTLVGTVAAVVLGAVALVRMRR